MKLLIVDDERIICETISRIIDWKKYKIDIIPPCLNGLDAYDVIIDELPEIVITDIRMPGINGIELVKRIKEMKLETQFILLSGFSEFNYAKEAMQYGVKHYLLKPCNEQQIISSVHKCMEDYCELKQLKRLKDSRFASLYSLQHNMLFSFLNDILYDTQSYDEIVKHYEPYINFYTDTYKIFYIYYLEPQSVEKFLLLLEDHCRNNISPFSIYGIYVKNTFILFLHSYAIFEEKELSGIIQASSFYVQAISPAVTTDYFHNLYSLLKVIIPKVKRYETIYYMNHFHLLYTCNYSSVSERLNQYCQMYRDGNTAATDKIMKLFGNLTDISYLRLLLRSFMMQMSFGNPHVSALGMADWLLQIENEENLKSLRNEAFKKIKEVLQARASHSKLSSVTQQVCSIIHEHLEDPNITLKSIAEEFLFMNVDYVSKKFQKEMGIKFSKYLTKTRIEKAKEYLKHSPDMRIQDIAEKIGFYHNPRYFSQLFKKVTGLTPRAYLTSLKEL